MAKVLPPPYTFGVEIECFGVPPAVVTWAFDKAGIQSVNIVNGDDMQPGWREARNQVYNDRQWVIGADCTINGEHPMEIKSPILKGFDGIETLARVLKILKDLGAKTNDSTGLHVHVGVRGSMVDAKQKLDVPTIIEVVKRWAKHEKTIQLLVSEGRRDGRNQYCYAASRLAHKLDQYVGEAVEYGPERLPEYILNMRRTYGDSPGTLDEIGYFYRYGFGDYTWRDGRRHAKPEKLLVSTMTHEELARLSSHYDSVSLTPLIKYGTLEFRLHHGVIDATMVCAWVSFILNHIETTRRLVKGEAGAGRGRKPGLFAGMPATYRNHLQKRIVDAQPKPVVASPPSEHMTLPLGHVGPTA
jgi:hypothetical protein